MRRLAALVVAVVLCGGCTVEELIALAFAEHGPDVQAQAVEVARCESGHDPGATNGQYLGLFQLGRYHYWRIDAYGGRWDDPLQNAQAAADLYAEQGWRPWTCRP